MKNQSDFLEKAKLVRKWSLISTTEGGSGHPTSCLSAADIGTVLFNNYFTYDIKNPDNLNNDRFILSKGHASPLLYTLFAMSGGLPLEELKTLRKFGSRLEGHPTPNFPYADAATGSLGQGLSMGAGFAISAKKDNLRFKTFVLLGDGEMAEGSVWEAANFASHYKLDNLIAIADINRLGQSQETMFGHKVEEYINRFSAFGFEVIAIDGHNFNDLEKAFELAVNNKSGKPFVIVAKTIKGKGVSFLEDKDNWHGKALKKEELEKAILELGKVDDSLRFELKHRTIQNNTQNNTEVQFSSVSSVPSSSVVGSEVATREVYGEVLAEMGNTNPLIYALDGDTKNSTHSEIFMKFHPDRFIECFIAEQNMVGVAVGLSKTGKIPFVSTFACFLTRAFDQIRMSAISKANVKFVGSHAGVSIGEDGPSQMALEDIAMFGAIPDSIILHPCDGVSMAKLLPFFATHIGTSYLRTLRPKTPVIYSPTEEFVIGGSKILKQSENDLLTVAVSGITVFEALKAYDELKKENINIRIIDCYSIKPIDREALVKCVNETKNKIVISVEDHFEHGGLGDFILSALSKTDAVIEKMAVKKISRSGTKDELLNYAEIDSKNIINKVKELLA